MREITNRTYAPTGRGTFDSLAWLTVVLADETVRSLAAGDKVSLNPERFGACCNPLLDIGRSEKVVDTTKG